MNVGLLGKADYANGGHDMPGRLASSFGRSLFWLLAIALAAPACFCCIWLRVRHLSQCPLEAKRDALPSSRLLEHFSYLRKNYITFNGTLSPFVILFIGSMFLTSPSLFFFLLIYKISTIYTKLTRGSPLQRSCSIYSGYQDTL